MPEKEIVPPFQQNELQQASQELTVLLKKLREIVPAEESNMWRQSDVDWLHARSIDPKTIVLRHLTEKKVPGISDGPMADRAHPTMKYLMIIRYQEDGMELNIFPGQEHRPIIQLQGESTPEVDALSNTFNVRRIPNMTLHVPPTGEQSDAFLTEIDTIKPLVLAFTETQSQ
jgi:hypothetical protein